MKEKIETLKKSNIHNCVSENQILGISLTKRVKILIQRKLQTLFKEIRGH